MPLLILSKISILTTLLVRDLNDLRCKIAILNRSYPKSILCTFLQENSLRDLKIVRPYDLTTDLANIGHNRTSQITLYMYMFEYHTNKDLSIMPILSTWPMNVLGGNPFVSGSAIIRSVPICSIDTL